MQTLNLSITLIIAMQTEYRFPKLPTLKDWFRGWFFAGNDLSSIFAIMFPIVVLYSIHKTTSFSKIYYWIPTILAMYASIMVGTKVGYGAIVLTLGVALLFLFIEYMVHRKKEGKGFTYTSCRQLLPLLYLGGLIALTPHTPIAKNMGIHMQIYEYKKSVQEEKDRKEGKIIKEDPDAEKKHAKGE